jgi:predicted Fe-S protein YdhL (DUF1289 family)
VVGRAYSRISLQEIVEWLMWSDRSRQHVLSSNANHFPHLPIQPAVAFGDV